MPVNRLALIRYKTIDNCLRNRFRKWTIHNLVEACSDALFEFEGKYQGVSLRTIQLDIQNMRSEKLGYNAPIVVVDKKYYTYDDPDYSITNMPLTPDDISVISQITHTLQQFQGFSQFADMHEVLKKIENKIFAINNKNKTIIDFEKNNNLKGLEFIDPIYNAIKEKKNLKIVYQPFSSKNPIIILLSPYLLKEYRNRWFVFGAWKKNRHATPLALDRILRLTSTSDYPFAANSEPDFEKYFNNIIGVTKHINRPVEEIVFHVTANEAPYVITKPFHHSQKIISTDETGTTFSLNLILNFEAERELIGFGESLTILKPEWFRKRFKERITKMLDNYNQTV